MKKLVIFIAIIFSIFLSSVSFGQTSNSEIFTIKNVEIGEINTLINNIMEQTGVDSPKEAIRLVNSGEWILTGPTCTWTKKDGVIYLSVTSDGTTGSEWIIRLNNKGLSVSAYAKSMLKSKNFKPSISGTTYEVAILKGEVFIDNYRITENIRKVAEKRKFIKPNAEVVCLILEHYSNEEIKAMGLDYIVMMHEPIYDYDGNFRFFSISCYSYNGSFLDAYSGYSWFKWISGGGFAFIK